MNAAVNKQNKKGETALICGKSVSNYFLVLKKRMNLSIQIW